MAKVELRYSEASGFFVKRARSFRVPQDDTVGRSERILLSASLSEHSSHCTVCSALCLIAETHPHPAPDAGVGPEMVGQAIGVIQVSIDAPLSVTPGKVEERVKRILPDQPRPVMLEPAVDLSARQG